MDPGNSIDEGGGGKGSLDSSWVSHVPPGLRSALGLVNSRPDQLLKLTDQSGIVLARELRKPAVDLLPLFTEDLCGWQVTTQPRNSPLLHPVVHFDSGFSDFLFGCHFS